jgi:mannose-6-phosphate isomerase
MSLSALLFDPLFKETLWGGQNLGTVLGKKIPAGKTIGESWEVADHPNGTSRIVSGSFAGQTFHEVFQRHPEEILGPRLARIHTTRFPLLIKFIDAADALSVQVHPDDVYAGFHENGSAGKTEAWYVVHADPGAFLIAGFSRPTDRKEFEQVLSKGGLEGLLRKVPVKSGEFLFIPAGRVHAIMPGILLNEIQQNSDITYRVYDWDRKTADGGSRELHVRQSLETMDFRDSSAGLETPKLTAPGVELLTENRFFTAERIRPAGIFRDSTSATDSFHVFSVVAGRGLFSSDDGSFPIRLGDSFLAPWSCGGYSIEGEGLVLLRSRM